MWRAIFLPFYLTYLIAGISVNLFYFMQTPEHAGWLASTLCHLIALIWFLYLRSSKLANVNLITVVITASSGAALLISAGYYVIVDDAAGLGLAAAALAFVLWFVYQLSCLKIRTYRGPLKVGDSFPQLKINDGSPLPIPDQKQWLVLHEGYWSAFARHQANLLQEAAADFKEHTCEIVHLAMHSHGDTNLSGVNQVMIHSAEALDANKLLLPASLPYGVKSDSSHRHVARPSAFLINETGHIEAIVVPDDRRKLPGALFMLRYLTKKGA